MKSELVLTGLDGTNPAGFLAGLGALRVLSERGEEARLSWRLDDAWRPVLWLDDPSGDRLLDLLAEDLEAWRKSGPELGLSYEKQTEKQTKRIYELKPPPAHFQAYAREAVRDALSGSRRWADYAAAYAAAHEEQGVDNTGQSQPTALHFMRGQQLFLDAVKKLVEGTTRDALEEAVFRRWTYKRRLPVLGWDIVAGERDYALRASDPSRDKKTGVPGADWLGYRGMPFFPVMLRDGAAATTAFHGDGKRYWFHWALWEPPVTADVAKTVVAVRWDDVGEDERRQRGIVLALRSRVRRKGKGGYGSFSAATVE